MVTKDAPEGLFHYTTGKKIPRQIPMWTVQNEGYLTGRNARVGMVSRGTASRKGRMRK